MTQERLFTVKEVARLTDIPAATLRKWEQRYQVVSPVRLPNGYRVYTARDVAVLRWVGARVQEGTPISQAVRAAHEKLSTGWQEAAAPALAPTHPGTAADYAERLIQALTAIDEDGARHLLDEAFAVLQVEQVLGAVITPALREIGCRWEAGAISEYQEHFASVMVRDRLASLRTLLPRGSGPHLITACLPGELHEIGILIVTILALRRGFRVTHLSGSPSPDGLKRAIQELRPAAVLLSSTVPEHLAASLTYLEELALLPAAPPVVVAGQAVTAFPALPQIRGIRFTTDDPAQVLAGLRDDMQ